eukprot:244956_1
MRTLNLPRNVRNQYLITACLSGSRYSQSLNWFFCNQPDHHEDGGDNHKATTTVACDVEMTSFSHNIDDDEDHKINTNARAIDHNGVQQELSRFPFCIRIFILFNIDNVFIAVINHQPASKQAIITL